MSTAFDIAFDIAWKLVIRRRSKVGTAKASPPDRQVRLKPRQLEIALMVADGLSTRKIASQLDVTTKTEEYHRYEISKTLGIKSTALLVRWLIREGLLEP
jgi:DNA-binding NarL/FixJ family response regulator